MNFIFIVFYTLLVSIITSFILYNRLFIRFSYLRILSYILCIAVLSYVMQFLFSNIISEISIMIDNLDIMFWNKFLWFILGCLSYKIYKVIQQYFFN